MEYQGTVVVSKTESVCPVCLTSLPATLEAAGDTVVMRKICPEHGRFTVPVWRGAPSYETWARPNPTSIDAPSSTSLDAKGCPFDCGVCPEHRQQTCTALVEVTSRCNLKCSFCFADAGFAESEDPDLSEIAGLYESLLGLGYKCNVQLSGGEPTLRDDLPEIVALGRSLGLTFIQLNTNGIRLGSDPSYVERLKEAGLSSVFLQFDGTEDEIYRTLRGRALLETKVRAVSNCREMQLGVVLVPTLVPGVNLHNVGAIIGFALENLPAVRGVHFQPAVYSGRYPGIPTDESRLTLPEVMRAIEHQTKGVIKLDHFGPPGCENPVCSFHGNFVLMPDGKLHGSTIRQSGACSCRGNSSQGSARSGDCLTAGSEGGAARTRKHVAQHWAFPEPFTSSRAGDDWPMGQWDVLLERAGTHMLSISAMAFQDAWNLDLERLKDCCIHVVGRDGSLIPFCAYNLTGSTGAGLYRNSGRQ